MATLEERFEAKVDRSGEHHIWTGAKTQNGSGVLKVQGRLVTAHRVAWQLAKGEVPPGVEILGCPEEKACVRPDHLSLRGENLEAHRPKHRRAHGSGSMQRVRPGVWKFTVTNGRWDDGAPRREYRTVEADNEAEASRELAAFIAELDGAGAADKRSDRDITVDEGVSRYLEHLSEDMGREKRTVNGYADVYQKWFKDRIGTQRLRDVDKPTMDKLFGRMRRANLGQSRMKHAKSLFSGLFSWAKDQRIIRHPPIAKDYQVPKSLKSPKERKPPEVEQLALWLATAVELVPNAAPVFTLAATTGMRRGELAVVPRSAFRPARSELKVATAADLDGSIKRTKTDDEREISLDSETVTMLVRHCELMDKRAAACGVEIAEDAFLFSLEPDCSRSLTAEYLSKAADKVNVHLGIANKRSEVIALEDEALRLFRQPAPPRPPGRRGPSPKGGMSYKEIGKHLNRSDHWVKKALVAAKRREEAAVEGGIETFDGTILALRKFSSSALLDAGFNVKVAADRQGHTPETLMKHYAKRRKSADIKAAEHLGRLVHGPSDEPDPDRPGPYL